MQKFIGVFCFCCIFIKKKIMKKIVRLTEQDLVRLVKRVITESQIPSWAIGKSMNFYGNKQQSGNPTSFKITTKHSGIRVDNTTGQIEIMDETGKNKLKFKCYSLNNEGDDYYGSFELNNGRVYNKTIAEKYFAPEFCTKNSQGKWVQKVENPDFAQTGMNKQQGTV